MIFSDFIDSITIESAFLPLIYIKILDTYIQD